MYEIDLKVVNQFGIHARAATCIVRLAAEYDEEVTINHQGNQAHARSLLELLTLAAPKGSVVKLRISGSDEDSEKEVGEAFRDLFERGFYES